MTRWRTSEGAVVAYIGFGGGVGVELLLDRVGADGRLSLHAASLTDLPLRAAALDGAITINTICFIADQHRAFSELARGGRGRAAPSSAWLLPRGWSGLHCSLSAPR